MKKLFLLTLTMFLFGCDPVEQDTRLICDCDYVYSDFERSECDSSVYNMNNRSLVFNESKNKFVFGMLDMTRFDQAVTFGEDSIIFSRDTERTKSNNQLNKINLIYSEYITKVNEERTLPDGEKYYLWDYGKTTFYNCRLTDGV